MPLTAHGQHEKRTRPRRDSCIKYSEIRNKKNIIWVSRKERNRKPVVDSFTLISSINGKGFCKRISEAVDF